VKFFAGKNLEVRVYSQIVQKLTPLCDITSKYGSLRFLCLGMLPEYRARTLFTKEPETIAWIDSIPTGEVLWDVGANVGVYSLYAAKRGLSVQSFEPGAGNYYMLCRNIELNNLSNSVHAYCLAFNNITCLDMFYMSSTDLGGSLNSFGEATDWRGESFSAAFRQAAMGFTVDEFIQKFSPPFPAHIKIDVDGIEKKIVLGAGKTLSDLRLKSVLIELNTEWKDYQEILVMFGNAGMVLHARVHAPMFDNTELRAVFNHIFIRPESQLACSTIKS
jgi:FkbM family methyltransferase